jgi:hypothetical protein
VATFMPVIGTTIFCVLAYDRIGFGPVGKFICSGFLTLMISLAVGLLNNTIGPNEYLQFASGITRLLGWLLLCSGFLFHYIEADRSIP